MGKDYSADSYKKTYEKDYVKTYGKGYETIIVKGATVSNPTIGEIVRNPEMGRVNPAGPDSVIVRRNTDRVKPNAQQVPEKVLNQPVRSIPQSPKGKPRDNRASEAKDQSLQEVLKDLQQQTKATPVSNVKEKAPLVESRNQSGRYSHIDPHAMKAPIIRLSKTDFKDNVTQEVFDVKEARARLTYGGYSPKPMKPVGSTILTSLIAIIIPILGPVFLFYISSSMKGKDTTVYEKGGLGGNLQFTMPATADEKKQYEERHNLFQVLAFIAGGIQYFVFISFK